MDMQKHEQATRTPSRLGGFAKQASLGAAWASP